MHMQKCGPPLSVSQTDIFYWDCWYYSSQLPYPPLILTYLEKIMSLNFLLLSSLLYLSMRISSSSRNRPQGIPHPINPPLPYPSNQGGVPQYPLEFLGIRPTCASRLRGVIDSSGGSGIRTPSPQLSIRPPRASSSDPSSYYPNFVEDDPPVMWSSLSYPLSLIFPHHYSRTLPCYCCAC